MHLYKGQSCDHESVVDRFCLINLDASRGGIDLQLYATVPAQKRAIQDQVLGLHMLLVTVLAPKSSQPPAADRVQLADFGGIWRQSLGPRAWVGCCHHCFQIQCEAAVFVQGAWVREIVLGLCKGLGPLKPARCASQGFPETVTAQTAGV